MEHNNDCDSMANQVIIYGTNPLDIVCNDTT